MAAMSADTAPAEMPGEAEPNDAPCYLSASEASAWASGFNAAHQALAPILAEKERLREALHYANGVAELAMKHRDVAEAALAAEREKAAKLLDDMAQEHAASIGVIVQVDRHQVAANDLWRAAAALRAQGE